MKKSLTIAALIIALGLEANAQKLDASKVPAPVKESFAKKYPKIASVKWELEKGNYEAGFKQDGQSISVLFTANGTMTESEVDIKTSELPAAALSYVKTHYKGKSIKEGAKITKVNGEINYEAEVNGKDVIFDANGKFLKEESD
ncbi:MAG TPA: PepSY-like domain-containing protein [Puia sp.]|nr:PepSY-like domain-containing protein [Puia sp.]